MSCDDSDKDRPGKMITSSCGFVDFMHEFDHETFGISKREAECMDPQQQMLLEVWVCPMCGTVFGV